VNLKDSAAPAHAHIHAHTKARGASTRTEILRTCVSQTPHASHGLSAGRRSTYVDTRGVGVAATHPPPSYRSALCCDAISRCWPVGSDPRSNHQIERDVRGRARTPIHTRTHILHTRSRDSINGVCRQDDCESHTASMQGQGR